MTAWTVVVGLVPCTTPLLPVGVVLLVDRRRRAGASGRAPEAVHEYVRAGDRLNGWSTEDARRVIAAGVEVDRSRGGPHEP